jgi:hypothetical protein
MSSGAGHPPCALAHQEVVDLRGRDPQHAARIPRGDASGEKPPGELLAGADRDRRQPALADQPLAVLADQMLNRRRHRGRLGRNGALSPQVLKQRPSARSRQPPAIVPTLGQEAAHRLLGELIDRERVALQPPTQVPQRDQRPDDHRSRVAAPGHQARYASTGAVGPSAKRPPRLRGADLVRRRSE